MFPVGRFDPSAKSNTRTSRHFKHQKKRKRSRSKDLTSVQDHKNSCEQEPQSHHVIAEDVEQEHGNTKTPVHEFSSKEAFDDLDIVEAGLGEVDRIDSTADEGVAADQELDDNITSQDIQRAQRISKLPIDEAASVLGVRPFLVENLRKAGFDHFFPIQAVSIPHVLAAQRHPHIRAHDVCISAPTGSGKTLAYVIPVLNALSTRKITRLRALVVLPSRDLARQVHQVFIEYTKGSSLQIGLAVGQSDFRREQIALTVDEHADDLDTYRRHIEFEPSNLELALKAYPLKSSSTISSCDSGCSAVDVLVCTPGRLVDHLEHTPRFTLQHLQFLIVDEADRLLNQKYHNWIDRVIESANEGIKIGERITMSHASLFGPGLQAFRTGSDGVSFICEPITWRRMDDTETGPSRSVAASTVQSVQLRKILVSATLTKDPQKLASLHLCNPKYFDVHSLTGTGKTSKKYSIPDTISESLVECTAEQKPLALLSILIDELELKRGNRTYDQSRQKVAAVFTASIDSTHRLARLLQLMWVHVGFGSADSVVEFSSAANQNERSDLLRRCNDPNGDVAVIVCSDGMSRGMDVHSVGTVINYDVPSFAKVYIHRCGRTGRAGKSGRTYTLLKGGQMKQFERMRALINDAGRVRTIETKRELVRDVVPQYRICVKALREVLESEEDGVFKGTDTLPEEFFEDVDE